MASVANISRLVCSNVVERDGERDYSKRPRAPRHPESGSVHRPDQNCWHPFQEYTVRSRL